VKIAAAAVGGEGDNMMIMNKKHKNKSSPCCGTGG